MSQLDTRFGRGDSSVGSLDRLPATPALAGWDVSLGQTNRLSPARPAAPAAIGQAELRRVVLVESDQYYREALTFELLRQGFVVHAFADGALAAWLAGQCSRCRPCRARLGPGKDARHKATGRTAPAWRQPARRVPDWQGHRRRRARPMRARPAGNSECQRMHGVRPWRGRLHPQVPRQASSRQAAEKCGRTRQAQGQAPIFRSRSA